MIQTLDNLNNVKVKLTVPIIANFILKGLKQADIAKACNVSDQAVSSYIKKHYDEIIPIVDPTDRLMALQSKNIARKALSEVDNIFAVEDFTKRDLVALSTLAGTQIDKYRLLSDKSTQNVNVATARANIKEIESEQQQLLKEINRLENGSDMAKEIDGEAEAE